MSQREQLSRRPQSVAKPDGQKEDPETSAVTTHEARRVPGSRSLLMELSSITRLLSSNGSTGLGTLSLYLTGGGSDAPSRSSAHQRAPSHRRHDGEARKRERNEAAAVVPSKTPPALRSSQRGFPLLLDEGGKRNSRRSFRRRRRAAARTAG